MDQIITVTSFVYVWKDGEPGVRLKQACCNGMHGYELDELGQPPVFFTTLDEVSQYMEKEDGRL